MSIYRPSHPKNAVFLRFEQKLLPENADYLLPAEGLSQQGLDEWLRAQRARLHVVGRSERLIAETHHDYPVHCYGWVDYCGGRLCGPRPTVAAAIVPRVNVASA
jgi:hypothetical protein